MAHYGSGSQWEEIVKNWIGLKQNKTFLIMQGHGTGMGVVRQWGVGFLLLPRGSWGRQS